MEGLILVCVLVSFVYLEPVFLFILKINADLQTGNWFAFKDLRVIYVQTIDGCTSRCSQRTGKKSNVWKVFKKQGSCHCFQVAKDDFVDSRETSPQLQVTSQFLAKGKSSKGQGRFKKKT